LLQFKSPFPSVALLQGVATIPRQSRGKRVQTAACGMGLLPQHNLTASIVRIHWRDKVEKATRVIRQNSPTMLPVDAYKIGTFC